MTSTYNDKVLNGNWNEERAKPLKGVMVDYGYRIYGSTQNAAFEPPKDAYGATRAAVMKARANDVSFAVTQPETSLEAQRFSVAPDEGFRTVRQAARAANAPDHYSSTYRLAFGKGEAPPLPTGPAIGRSGARVERGMATSGMIGEVYKCSADPQDDTACQRSWLPTGTLIMNPATREFNR